MGPNVFAEMELDATENTPESSLLATDTNPSEENLEITDSEEQNKDSESDMNQQRAANPIEPADSGEYQYTAKEVGETNGLIQFGQRQFDVIYGGLMCGGTSIANKEKPEEPKTCDLHVTKTWELQGGEIPRKQLPPTGEVMNGYVIIGFLLLMNSIIMLTWVNHSKKY